jgi:hypothetical protein
MVAAEQRASRRCIDDKVNEKVNSQKGIGNRKEDTELAQLGLAT